MSINEHQKDITAYMYTLSSGHTVYLIRLSARLTYRGLISGTTQRASDHIRQTLASEVAEQMPPGKPLVIIDEGNEELPGFIWTAEFQSDDGVKDDEYDEDNDWDTGSRLFVCWFSEGISDTLNANLQAMLESIDWENNAENFLNLP